MNRYLKRGIYIGTRLSQVLGANFIWSKKNKMTRKVVFYPPFCTESDLADHVNRVRWYIPKSAEAEIWMATVRSLNSVVLKNLPVPVHQIRPTNDGNDTNIRLCGVKDLINKLKSADVICVWNINNSARFKNLLPRLLRLRIVDPNFYLFSETHTNAALLWYDLLGAYVRTSWTEQSLTVLKRMFQDFSGSKRAYVFGTGPSSKEAENHNYMDGVRIICNSMVRNDQLLDRIRPQVLTFSDSVFHFGVSKHAEAFAEDVIKVVRRYSTYCVTSQVGYALMRAHYPELTAHLIGIPALRFGRSVQLLPTSFKTRDHANILTRYMLPLAAGLSTEIVMMGFDGRKPDESYFWQHNSTTQYTDSMESVRKTHSAFFRDVNYDAYYRKHCSVLSEMIEEFEHRGIKVVVWGNSYIPALQKRCLKT